MKGIYYLELTNKIRTTVVTTVDSVKNKYSVRYSRAKKLIS